jgi:YVTN family beta-propeller protein
MTEVGDGPGGPGGATQGMVVSPDGSKLYTVGVGYGGVISGPNASAEVIDTASNSVLATIGVNECEFCYGTVALSPDGSALYIATGMSEPSLDQPGGGNLYVVNASTYAIYATISLPFFPKGINVTPDGTKIYIVNYYGDAVAVFDTATNTLRPRQTAVGGWPTGFGNFIIGPSFAGTPEDPTCRGQTNAALAAQFGSFDAAFEALGFYSETGLRKSVRAFCGGSELVADEEGR